MDFNRRECILMSLSQLSYLVEEQIEKIVADEDRDDDKDFEIEVTVGDYGELGVVIGNMTWDEWMKLRRATLGSLFKEDRVVAEDMGELDDYETKRLVEKAIPFRIYMVANDRPPDHPEAHQMEVAFIGLEMGSSPD